MTASLGIKDITFDSLDQIFLFFVKKSTSVCWKQKCKPQGGISQNFLRQICKIFVIFSCFYP